MMLQPAEDTQVKGQKGLYGPPPRGWITVHLTLQLIRRGQVGVISKSNCSQKSVKAHSDQNIRRAYNVCFARKFSFAIFD